MGIVEGERRERMMDEIKWRPLKPGENMPSSLIPKAYNGKWALYLSGENGYLYQQTREEIPPKPNMKPLWKDGKWYWEEMQEVEGE